MGSDLKGSRLPGNTLRKQRSIIERLLTLFGTLAAIIGLVVLMWNFIRSDRERSCAQAASNARQIYWYLEQFEDEYGKLPDASTAAAVAQKAGKPWIFKNVTSNDLLKQLLAADINANESTFETRMNGCHMPDYVANSEARALAKGECGFAYIPGASVVNKTDRPILVSPLLPGSLRFDPVAFGGEAVVLRANGQVTRYPIDAEGRAIQSNGLDLFDLQQPCWGGTPPDVKWPDINPNVSHVEEVRWELIKWVSVSVAPVLLGFAFWKVLRRLA